MSTIINADTSDGLKFTSDTSGEIKLQSAGTDIATVSSSGITMASGKELTNADGNAVTNTPICSVYIAANQTLTEATNSVILFDSVDIDTDSAFNTSTSRFTVPVGKAGKYHIDVNARLYAGSSSDLDLAIAMIYVNGVMKKRNYFAYTANYINTSHPTCSAILNLAEGDYVQGAAYINTNSNTGGFLLSASTQSSMYIHRLIG